MRVLLAVVLGLAILWGGYWFVGSRALQRGAESWFLAQQQHGLVAERESLVVRGFPNRFDLTVEGLHLADPVGGFGWKAPFIQIFSLTYKPWHVIAALPPEQLFLTPRQDITLAAAKLQGSVVVEPNRDLALDRTAVVGKDLVATSTLGWQVKAAEVQLHTRQYPAEPNAHEISLDITGLAPGAAMVQALAARTDLPATIDTLQLTAIASFTAPVDRQMGETRPGLARLTIRDARILWGTLAFSAKGSVSPDAQGFAAGRIELRVENWRQALVALQALGIISPELAPTAERAFELLSQQSGSPGTVDLPLSFQSGRMSLGPFPIGPAPSLR